jgi:hypothetical protein
MFIFCFKPLTGNLPGGPRETSVGMIGVPGEIRTVYFPNTSQKHSGQIQLTRCHHVLRLMGTNVEESTASIFRVVLCSENEDRMLVRISVPVY